MSYFSFVILGFIHIGIALMPVWILSVAKTLWPLPIKRATMITMTTISVISAAFVVTRSGSNLTTRIIGSLVIIIYLIIVLATTFRTWPRYVESMNKE